MSSELEFVSPDVVVTQLQESGLVGSSRNLHLHPLPRNPGRRDYFTRRAFRVSEGPTTICHLLVGPGLAGIWSRAQAFALACPEITAKPLFMRQTAHSDFLGVEFIEGRTVEQIGLTANDHGVASRKAVMAVVVALEQTMWPSTAAAAHAELERFFASVLACTIIEAIDRDFLRDVVFPWVREGATASPAQTRWTNGDLIAQNIIVDASGHPRLIDYEFAHRTHFYAEDILRWRTYSNAHRDLLDDKLPETPSWLEALFLLRQTVLECETSIPSLALQGTQQRVQRLRELTASVHSRLG
jgi:hypothetical protein